MSTELASQDHELLLELLDWIEVCEPRVFTTRNAEVWADLIEAGYVELSPTTDPVVHGVLPTRSGRRHAAKLRPQAA